ncbi:hypothetical protein [Helicobacter sp.]|uniref:hypothetical protein n=1 Tax=Helicobacter sp. TaxID=218 RepID=UPI0025C39DFD|nr:hypothetical protein [Helicobacter sp.]MCI5632757.1 hypothetical protein [Helicobacter sp.]
MPLIKPFFNPLKFSYFIFLQILSFTLIFMLLFFLSRLIMVLNFLPKSLINANFNDTILTFLLGAVSDLRLISAAFLPLLVAFILGFLMDYFANNWGGTLSF